MKAKYRYFDEIDSTNSECRRIAAQVFEGRESEKNAAFTVISAGRQTAGRGRTGRVWESPKADSVSTSMLLFPPAPLDRVSCLTILAAMAVSDAVEGLYPLKTGIKWPNDILIDKKKICGILTEMEPDRDRAKYVVVGIGVNVHQKTFPEEIADKATSLDLELGRCENAEAPTFASRKSVTHAIWERFLQYYEAFLKTADLSGIREAYNARLINREKRVRVLDPLKPFEGTARGIDDTGALLVQMGNGEVKAVDSGEVSVRGIYGYV